MKPFYSHLIIIEEIFTVLDTYSLTAEERRELEKLIHENISHEATSTVLKHLPEVHHKEFLDKKHLDFLDREIKAKVEEEVKKQGAKIKKDLLAEIKKSTKR
ncbi:hypothetical protein A2872_04305 [Candidatus Gottesmanbacteria bacterium RIFCSPHIGHO2_01_FULL_42_12]|uniref:Uncharacterized protein n=1 Tax=Candidatus Gottesmanbacteria bacterium RIFCSPHIGHO2_01_FULL_42_12 TaxID=1798377 RepID=A0A1F5Z1D6_9BACT|nr:MAG: hypothetical protein A2872_04305 [Candidatus Gottesmanbacteria bacterium RIFCSPHIGHO2_01_FULL_42_12]